MSRGPGFRTKLAHQGGEDRREQFCVFFRLKSGFHGSFQGSLSWDKSHFEKEAQRDWRFNGRKLSVPMISHTMPYETPLAPTSKEA
jgi:hypothetical protein